MIVLFTGIACNNTCAYAQGIKPDDSCTKVRQVFFGLDDIGKKGNTKIVPFSGAYREILASYFERGCPMDEKFPVPKPGNDMKLANTASDVITGGSDINFKLGEPLRR